ncbi:hypothetical protein [Sphingopyxis sp. JAI128]|nr:hypothetical protein [Sphingopyxis sp. JAI128]MBB6426882.1 hypothetical protein [Sphingopyxis sp. JAI128]
MAELLAAIEDNDQTYGRGRSTLDHRQISDVADALGVDTNAYKQFTKSL